METAGSFEINQTTHCYVPQECNLHDVSCLA
jgi:hypothetical protein